MIIYGTKSTKLVVEPIGNQCLNCQTNHIIDIHVFQKYAHLFWLPLFPIGKTGASQCNHCKQVLRQKDMPASLKLSFYNIKAKTKTPIWTWTGLALILLFIAFTIFFNNY